MVVSGVALIAYGEHSRESDRDNAKKKSNEEDESPGDDAVVELVLSPILGDAALNWTSHEEIQRQTSLDKNL